MQNQRELVDTVRQGVPSYVSDGEISLHLHGAHWRQRKALLPFQFKSHQDIQSEQAGFNSCP